MRPLRAWAIRLAGLFRARRRVEQFDAELASHVEMHVEDNIRAGMTPDEARRQALMALGGRHLRDEYRDRGGAPLVESLAQDVRFAVRMLRKSPGFTATAIIVLSLGIGANGAVFSLMNAALFKPLNGVSADGELMGLYSGDRTRPDRWRPFSYPEFVDLRDRNDVFSGLFAERMARLGVSEDGLTRRTTGTYVSSNYFQVLGASPVAGRFFTAEEERPGSGASVVVVGAAYWRRLGGPAGIVGRTVVLNARPMTIVGLAPEGFRGTMVMASGEFWLPLGASSLFAASEATGQDTIDADRSSFSLMLSGTLEPDVSVEEAQARLAPLAAALEAAYSQTNANQRLLVQPRSRINVGLPPPTDAEPMIGGVVVMTVAGLVLVVACFNLANLQLARGSVPAGRRSPSGLRLAATARASSVSSWSKGSCSRLPPARSDCSRPGGRRHGSRRRGPSCSTSRQTAGYLRRSASPASSAQSSVPSVRR